MAPTQTQENWEEVGGGQLVRWDAEKTIEGVYQGSVIVKGQYGEQSKHTLMQADGTVVDFYAPKILERLMLDPRIKTGATIRVVYTGKSETTKSGRNAKSFVVQVKGA